MLRKHFRGSVIRTLAHINYHPFPFARYLIFLGQGFSNSVRKIRPKRINYCAQSELKRIKDLSRA